MPDKFSYLDRSQSLLHLTALRAFEAAARHGSFVSAAQELSVTPAAVGSQVRILEAWLGLSLFERSKSGATRLTPTVTARAILPEISLGFEHIRRALLSVRQGVALTLTVTASVAFVGHWLLPRIAGFQAIHPDIALRLDVTDRIVEIGPGHADIGLRYGRGVWPGLTSIALLDDDLIPVCAPSLIGPGLSSPEELLRHVLIHDVSTAGDGETFPGWSAWFEMQGLDLRETRAGLAVNAPAAVIQAVLAGRGVALSRRALVASDLASGRLVLPFPDRALATDRGWYLVHRQGAQKLSQVAVFVAWAQAEAAG